MEAVRAIQKKLCSQAMLVAVLGAGVLIVFGEKALGKGLILGTLFSVLNFVLMAQFLPRSAAAGSTARAGAAALGSILIRFTLLAVPLVLSLRIDSIHFVGVVIGLFMVQLTLLFDHLVRKGTSSV